MTSVDNQALRVQSTVRITSKDDCHFYLPLHAILKEQKMPVLRNDATPTHRHIPEDPQLHHAPHNDVSVNDGPHIRR